MAVHHDDGAVQHDTTARPRSGIVRKIVVALIGTTFILVGIPLVPLIGPGWLIILTGLAILATEFEWAGRLGDAIRSKLKRLLGSHDEDEE